jgi:hypothetical protein
VLMMRPPRGIWSRIIGTRRWRMKHAVQVYIDDFVPVPGVMSPKLVAGTFPPALLNSTSIDRTANGSPRPATDSDPSSVGTPMSRGCRQRRRFFEAVRADAPQTHVKPGF